MPLMHHSNRRRSGFTLVELMVALVIVVFLASLVTPMVITAIKREKEQELRTALRQIRQAIDDYRQAGDEGRVLRLPGQTGYPRTLAVLVTGSPDVLDPQGRRLYFLRRIPRDPFFTDERVPAEDTWGKRSYASPPDKPEAGADVYDVYSMSEGTGINGVAYRRW
jgi:general secretion pathway protein G